MESIPPQQNSHEHTRPLNTSQTHCVCMRSLLAICIIQAALAAGRVVGTVAKWNVWNVISVIVRLGASLHVNRNKGLRRCCV